MQDVLASAIMHTVYAIWLAINSIRFSSDKVSIHATMSKISSMVTFSGSNSTSNCLPTDVVILQNFMIPPSQRRVKEILTVFWKPPTINWIKANTDGSVINSISTCGGIFQDFRGTYLGAFASKIGDGSVSSRDHGSHHCYGLCFPLKECG